MGPAFDAVLYCFLISAISAGCALAITALISAISTVSYGFVLEFCCGFIVSAVSVEMLPKAFEVNMPFQVILFFLLGVVISALLHDRLINRSALNHKYCIVCSAFSAFLLLCLLGFISGLMIGAGYAFKYRFAKLALVFVIIYNIPKNVLPLIILKNNRVKLGLRCAVMSIPVFLSSMGAFVGSMIGNAEQKFLHFMLATVSGMMLYGSMVDVSLISKRNYSGRFTAMGFIIGFIVCIILLKIIP